MWQYWRVQSRSPQTKKNHQFTNPRQWRTTSLLIWWCEDCKKNTSLSEKTSTLPKMAQEGKKNRTNLITSRCGWQHRHRRLRRRRRWRRGRRPRRRRRGRRPRRSRMPRRRRPRWRRRRRRRGPGPRWRRRRRRRRPRRRQRRRQRRRRRRQRRQRRRRRWMSASAILGATHVGAGGVGVLAVAGPTHGFAWTFYTFVCGNSRDSTPELNENVTPSSCSSWLGVTFIAMGGGA